jgi:hypothetical protein
MELYNLGGGNKNNLVVLRAIKLNFDELQAEGLQEKQAGATWDLGNISASA